MDFEIKTLFPNDYVLITITLSHTLAKSQLSARKIPNKKPNCWRTIFNIFSFLSHSTATKPVSNILTPLKTTESSAVNLISLQQQQQQLLAKKRGAQVLGTDADSIISCKKRNINLRLIRLKQIKENHADHVAEIYFLQTGGNMMDYPTWRKKAVNTPEFVNFMKQYRLEPNIADTPSTGVMSTSTLSTVTAAPTIQTVGQQSHSQNTTQTQPPPLISTNSPHGKQKSAKHKISSFLSLDY